jgi:hypothetical protein
MDELTRRGALAGAATLGALGLAGCVADDPGTDNGTASANGTQSEPGSGPNATATGNKTDRNESTGNETDGIDGSDNRSLAGTSIETTATGCDTGDDGTPVATVDGGELVIEGTIGAPTPCHEAVIDSADLTDGALSVVVDVADTARGCVQCLGALDYAATVEFAADLTNISELAGVTVDHAGGDTYTLTDGQFTPQDGAGDSPPGIASHSLTTVEATCGGRETHTVGRNGRTVVVEGAFTTPDPCHEAVMTNLAVENRTLSVEVGGRSTLDSDELCSNCLGEVAYRADITLESGVTVDQVDVRHDTPIQAPVREKPPGNRSR